MADKPVSDAPGMMILDRLIAAREPGPLAPLSIPVKDLLARFERSYTGAVSDVLREHALLNQALPSHLRPLLPQRTVAGIAFTVKSVPHTLVSGEMTLRNDVLKALHEDAFVVWDASGDERATQWGGVMTATAHRLGVRAACVEGGIRDTHQILAKNFPVFFKYQSPNAGLGRCVMTHFQTALQVGDVFICPGDVVIGDIDGVVVVPRHLAVEVLLRVEAMLADEERIFGWVEEGKTVDEITSRGGYF